MQRLRGFADELILEEIGKLKYPERPILLNVRPSGSKKKCRGSDLESNALIGLEIGEIHPKCKISIGVE